MSMILDDLRNNESAHPLIGQAADEIADMEAAYSSLFKEYGFLLKRVSEAGVVFKMDGDKVMATFGDFIDLYRSPAGFGNDNRAALVDLIRVARKP